MGIDKEYCEALENPEDLENSSCLIKETRRVVDKDYDTSCIAVKRDSFIAGTGEIKFSLKKARTCPCFPYDCRTRAGFLRRL